jgi:hypothetical protein
LIDGVGDIPRLFDLPAWVKLYNDKKAIELLREVLRVATKRACTLLFWRCIYCTGDPEADATSSHYLAYVGGCSLLFLFTAKAPKDACALAVLVL